MRILILTLMVCCFDQSLFSVEGDKRGTKRARTSSESSSGWISLNVGGQPILTKISTLRLVEDSMLARMFDPESGFSLEKDEKGRVLLDRDPSTFLWILGVLRRGGIVTTLPEKKFLDSVRSEADYYGLDGIVSKLDELVKLEKNGPRYEVSQKLVRIDHKYGAYGDTYKVPRGWSLKHFDEKRALIERRVEISEGSRELCLYANGREIACMTATFGSKKYVRGTAIGAKPYNASTELTNDQYIENNFAVVQRNVYGDVCVSFCEIARRAQSKGFAAVIIVCNELTIMDAVTEEACDITIPVVSVKGSYYTDSNSWMIEDMKVYTDPQHRGSVMELTFGPPRY